MDDIGMVVMVVLILIMAALLFKAMGCMHVLHAVVYWASLIGIFAGLLLNLTVLTVLCIVLWQGNIWALEWGNKQRRT